MEVEVVVSEGDSERSYVGLPVCKGPGMLRLLLTRPFGAAGQTVDIPVGRAAAVIEVETATPRDPVRRIDGEKGSSSGPG